MAVCVSARMHVARHCNQERPHALPLHLANAPASPERAQRSRELVASVVHSSAAAARGQK